MGDPGHLEITHLQRGTSVYQFGDAAIGLRLISLICSDAFDFTDAEAAQIYNRALVIHVQLNSKPRQHQYRLYREKLFRYSGDETELLCLNWAEGVCEWINGNEIAWNNPAGSAWYLRPREFDKTDATICANHKLGLYYTWLNSSRAHVLFLNFNAGAYLLEATKVAHTAVVASVSRRVGPKLRGVFTWNELTGELSDQLGASDGFSKILVQAGGAQADVKKVYDISPLAAERALALCAGRIRGGEKWHTMGELDSFGIDTSEIIRRITFCQDIESEASDFRAARLQRCANLWQILSDKRNLPAAMSDVGDGFYLAWDERRPHQNLISKADKPATAIYLGEETSKNQIDFVATSIAEYLRRSAANDEEGVAARQRSAVWFRLNGELILHDPDRYLRFDGPRSGSEFDITRQVR
jgi:hypothetical protein